MFTVKRGICTNKGDIPEFIFAKVMPLFGLKCFSEILFFSSPEHEALRVSYCDHSPSIGICRLSVVHSHFLVYTLVPTNINQSAPNLVKIYMTISSRMKVTMGLIGLERQELSALE